MGRGGGAASLAQGKASALFQKTRGAVSLGGLYNRSSKS